MMQTSARSGLLVDGHAQASCPRWTPVVGEVVESAVAAGDGPRPASRPGEADHLPADVVAVAAVDRVGVEALPGVEDQQREEVEVRSRRWSAAGPAPSRSATSGGARSGSISIPCARCVQHGQDRVLLARRRARRSRRRPGRGPARRAGSTPATYLCPADLDPLPPGVGAAAGELFEPAAVGLGVDVADPRQVAVEEVDRARLPRRRGCRRSG